MAASFVQSSPLLRRLRCVAEKRQRGIAWAETAHRLGWPLCIGQLHMVAWFQGVALIGEADTSNISCLSVSHCQAECVVCLGNKKGFCSLASDLHRPKGRTSSSYGTAKSEKKQKKTCCEMLKSLKLPGKVRTGGRQEQKSSSGTGYTCKRPPSRGPLLTS